MYNGAVLVLLVIEENEIAFFIPFTVGIGQKDGNVQVEIFTAIVFIGIPAKADRDFGQAWIGFGQIDLLTFGQINRHE
ncbi:hypothetical protein D3C81_2114970 [compost metagenome]